MMICPYCNAQARLRSSTVIFKRDFGMVRVCSNYPGCGAYVGVHLGSARPLGTMARYELRELRKLSHQAFDRFWEGQGWSRRQAYQWVAAQMRLPRSQAHIGVFREEQCRRLVELVTIDNMLRRTDANNKPLPG